MNALDRGSRRAKPAEGERVDRDERNGRVLHTRVPESLDRHIKRRARGLGLSVSTVVRNVLLNTFGLVEDIVTDGTNIALAMAGENAAPTISTRRARERTAVEATPGDVVAWQEAVLNVNAVCDQCNAVLRKGTSAAVGVRERPGPHTIICPRCLGRVGGPPPDAKAKRRRRRS
jgi:hypothetical protein